MSRRRSWPLAVASISAVVGSLLGFPFSAQGQILPSRTRSHLEQWLLLTVLLIPLSFTSLAAQDTPTAGDKVRVTTEEERIVGYWVAWSENGLTLRTEERDSSLVVPLGSLTKLEVSQGLRSRTLKGAGIGFLVGGAAGLATAAIACAIAGDCDPDDPLTPLVYAFFGVLGAGVGTLTGAIIGSIIKVDRWLDVPLDLRVSLTPNKLLGLTVSARVAF